MTTENTTLAEAAKRYIEQHGFKLVPIEPMRKFPQAADWGKNVISTPEKAEAFYNAHPDWNLGVALGPSGVCSLDIDCEKSFLMILDEFGIPHSELDEYPAIQGSGKGRRLMFRAPDGAELPYQKLNWYPESDPDGSIHRDLMAGAAKAKREGDHDTEQQLREQAKQYRQYTVFELRSGTDGKQRQDVLPPSIHPDTQQPYQWLVEPGDQLPEPPGWLQAIWEAWDNLKPQLQDACPWKPRPQREEPKRKPTPEAQGGNVIDQYLQSVTLEQALENYGYRQIGRRWLSPCSGTGLPGVTVFPSGQSCWIHHASDPLCSDQSGQPVNAFDLYCEWEHGGNAGEAVKQIAQDMGIQSPRRKTQQAQAMEQVVESPAKAQAPEQKPEEPEQDDNRLAMPQYFRSIGKSGDKYCYLKTDGTVVMLTSVQHSKLNFFSLAPLEWWEMTYPKQKGGCDWDSASSTMMHLCERVGQFERERKFRGRGAWFDEGRSVLHMGDCVVCDGTRYELAEFRSQFIYERRDKIDEKHTVKPATTEEAKAVSELMRQLPWSNPSFAQIITGWVVLAPVCGSLKWRPHIWLTAKRGAGKTWMLTNIVEPLVGQWPVVAQGATTEAGIRQTVRSDARPILFDEAESENAGGARRTQGVVELGRQSSSDNTAEVIKGTADGEGVRYRMRCMFMMQSINDGLTQAADESRFTVIQLGKPNKTPEQFQEFSRMVGNTLTPEFCASIRARVYRMIPVIRENAAIMAQAVAEVMDDQRIGDQIGTLMAGSIAMHQDGVISIETARDWVSKLDLSYARDAQQVSDEERCLQVILEHQVRVDTHQGSANRTIGEVVALAAGVSEDRDMLPVDANRFLARHGLMVRDGMLAVSNTHKELRSIFKDTAWVSGHKRVLSRIEGASASEQPLRFAGAQSRATMIPLSAVVS